MPIIRLQKYNKIIPYEPVLHWRELVKRRKVCAEAFLQNCVEIWINRENAWLQQCFSHWKRVREMLCAREQRRFVTRYCGWDGVNDDEIYIVNRIFENIAKCKKAGLRRYSI